MKHGLLLILCGLSALLAGCATTAQSYVDTENPSTIANPNYDTVWDATVQVIDKYFDIAKENRFDGTIVAKPMSSATLFEPNRPDAIGFRDRLQATLQTIRRRCYVLIQPSPNGGYAVTVEVYKELENLPQPIFSKHVGGALTQSIQTVEERIATNPIEPSAGWISLGRDTALEAKMIEEIRRSLDGC